MLHTQQSGGVTSTSLAGNAILKKIEGETTSTVQQVAIAKTMTTTGEENTSIVTSDANSQPKQQFVVASQGVNNAGLKSFVPVSKLQVGPMVGGKTTQVSEISSK